MNWNIYNNFPVHGWFEVVHMLYAYYVEIGALYMTAKGTVHVEMYQIPNKMMHIKYKLSLYQIIASILTCYV